MLREAASEYALETCAAELPIEHCIEWLVDWGREARCKQAGLLLLTAHRAKGLEFEHVAILDGDWQRLGPHEDADAPRRLLYVAMTRASNTLLLAHMQGAQNTLHQLMGALSDAPCLLQRAASSLPAPPAQLARRYVRLTPKDIDIGFAGRFGPEHAVHRAIAALSVGDPIALRPGAKGWELANADGISVARLSRAFAPPAHMDCISAQVVALLLRTREDSDPAQQNYIRCDRWENVMAELVFAPAAS